jgi:hypothetical protein
MPIFNMLHISESVFIGLADRKDRVRERQRKQVDLESAIYTCILIFIYEFFVCFYVPCNNLSFKY